MYFLCFGLSIINFNEKIIRKILIMIKMTWKVFGESAQLRVMFLTFRIPYWKHLHPYSVVMLKNKHNYVNFKRELTELVQYMFWTDSCIYLLHQCELLVFDNLVVICHTDIFKLNEGSITLYNEFFTGRLNFQFGDSDYLNFLLRMFSIILQIIIYLTLNSVFL